MYQHVEENTIGGSVRLWSFLEQMFALFKFVPKLVNAGLLLSQELFLALHSSVNFIKLRGESLQEQIAATVLRIYITCDSDVKNSHAYLHWVDIFHENL